MKENIYKKYNDDDLNFLNVLCDDYRKFISNNKIEREVAKIKGVNKVTVNFMTTKMTIDADDDRIDEIEKEAEKIVNQIKEGISEKIYNNSIHRGHYELQNKNPRRLYFLHDSHLACTGRTSCGCHCPVNCSRNTRMRPFARRPIAPSPTGIPSRQSFGCSASIARPVTLL